MPDIERHNARRLADAARAAGPPPSLEAQLEALSKTAQVLADRAKPHVQALAHTAQELTVAAMPHLEAFAETVASSVQGAQPKLEALADSTIEASAEAAAKLESLRQWCLEQAACDIEREHVRSNNAEAGEEGVESPSAEPEAAAVASRGVSPVMRAAQGSELTAQQQSLSPPELKAVASRGVSPGMRAAQGSELPAQQQSLSPPEEEAAATPSCFLPPPGLHFETARLLADQRHFFAQRNPTLLTHQNADQPVHGIKSFAA